MPMLDRTGLLLKDGIPKNPVVALLVQETPDGPIQALNTNCPLKMLMAFCAHLEVVNTTHHGQSIVLVGAPIQAFRAIGLWMSSCVDAKKKIPFPTPDENTYIRLYSLKKAATSLRLDDLTNDFERKMHNLDFEQLHIGVVKHAYATADSPLRQRVAASIAKLFWDKRIRGADQIFRLREQIPEFDEDINQAMNRYYEASAARKAQWKGQGQRSGVIIR